MPPLSAKNQPTTQRAAPGLAGFLLLALVAAGCGEERSPVRLGTLLPDPPSSASELPLYGPVGGGLEAGIELDAARVARLTIRARGSASLLHLDWRLAQEGRFEPYRRLSIPLVGDGEEHLYRIHLGREPYWSGTIGGLRLRTEDGELEIQEAVAHPGRSPYRDMALDGRSLPSIPAPRRLELELPSGWDGEAIFDVHLGILPEFHRPDVAVRFRAFTEREGGRRCAVWLDAHLSGSEEGNATWRRVRRQVPVRSGCRLVLESEATRGGTPLHSRVAVWGSPLLVPPPSRRPARTNLVLVVVDTLRADTVGAWGDDGNLTPRLDALASQSVRFDALWAPAPWTLPSVSTLLTGLQPQTHGAGRRVEGYAPTGLPEAALTLAEILSEEGYLSAGIYNNIYLNTAFGLQQGFDRYTSWEEPAAFLVDRALDELEELRHGPFFLLLHLFDPHNPYAPPEDVCREVLEREGLSAEGGCHSDRRPELEVPPAGERPRIEALYRAEVAYTDREIGRFLDGLARLELDDSTVVAVVSDHGEEFWERLPAERRRGYRIDGDHGHTHYNELLRLVGMIRAPGLEPRVVRQPVEMADLLPTLLGRLQIPSPRVQGRDLEATFRGEIAAPPLLLSDAILHGPARWAVTRGSWKAIFPESAELPVELYDLSRDGGERHDLAEQRPKLLDELHEEGRRELDRRAEARRRLLQGEDALSATYLEWRHITKLRALGYLK